MNACKKTTVVWLFLIFNQVAYSQEIFIKGLVVSEDSTPVQYATIHDDSRKSGTFSDSLGRFSINLPVDIKELHVSAIGYKNKTVTIEPKDNLSDVYIVLTNDTFYLKEVLVSANKPKTKQITIGPRKKVASAMRFSSEFNLNSEVGMYIPNFEKTDGKIESVAFYLRKASAENEADDNSHIIRLRIYTVDEACFPANDLLLENVLLQVKSSKRYQLFKIDLEQYHISMPPNGLVVALEVVQKTQSFFQNKLDAPYILPDNHSFFEIALVDDQTNSFIYCDRMDKAKWNKTDLTSLARKHGLKVTNLVPYAKVTIKEYAD